MTQVKKDLTMANSAATGTILLSLDPQDFDIVKRSGPLVADFGGNFVSQTDTITLASNPQTITTYQFLQVLALSAIDFKRPRPFFYEPILHLPLDQDCFAYGSIKSILDRDTVEGHSTISAAHPTVPQNRSELIAFFVAFTQT